MWNILIKLVFIISLLFCFIDIDVRALETRYDSDYHTYIRFEYDLIGDNKLDIIKGYGRNNFYIRYIDDIDNSDIIPSGDGLNRYTQNERKVGRTSKNIIIFLIILIMLGLIQLRFFDINDWFRWFLLGYIVDFVDKLVNLGYYLGM